MPKEICPDADLCFQFIGAGSGNCLGWDVQRMMDLTEGMNPQSLSGYLGMGRLVYGHIL